MYKILFISSWFPNKLEPTNGNFVQRHANAVSLIVDVQVLHSIGNPNQKEKIIFEDSKIDDIRTLIVYYKKSKYSFINFFLRINAYFKGFKMLNKPDLIHANILNSNIFIAILLKIKYKIPFIVTEHWTAFASKNIKNTSLRAKLFANLIAKFTDFIIPVSNDLSKGLKKIGLKNKMIVIPNVVDIDLFNINYNKKNDFTFIHVSNLSDVKNSNQILNSAINLINKGYDFKLQLGGDGTIQKINELKNIVNKNNLSNKIEIFHIQTINQIAERMKNSNALILFSSVENQPCVIAEAFSCGLKVISTNVGGISELFPDFAGIIIPDINQNLLENSMIQLIKDNNNHSEKIRTFAIENFSQQIIAKKYFDIYNRCC